MRSTPPIIECRGWLRSVIFRFFLTGQAFKEIKALSNRMINEFWADVIKENDKLPQNNRLVFIKSSDGREILSDNIRLISGFSLVKAEDRINYMCGARNLISNVIRSNGVYIYLEYYIDIYIFCHILSKKDIDTILWNVRNQNSSLHQDLENNDDFVEHVYNARRRGQTRFRLKPATRKGLFRRTFS